MDLSALTVLGLLVLAGIAWYSSSTRQSSYQGPVKDSDQKRLELIDSYKLRMDTALKPVSGDRELFLDKKRELLKTFSIELSSNIYFDSDEVRDLIRELAEYDITS